MGENNSHNLAIHAYKDEDGSMVPVDYDHVNNTFREFMNVQYFEVQTGISITEIPEWPDAPVSTIYDVGTDNIEGISAGKYHVFTNHFSELDNDYRITGEGSVDDLDEDQIDQLNALTPIPNSTISDTVPGSVIYLSSAIAEVEAATIRDTDLDEAVVSATEAATLAETAKTQADEAVVAATEAATLAGTAKTQADEAVVSATETATLAGIAKTQADEAVVAKTEAATEAGIAKTQADEAVVSATEALAEAQEAEEEDLTTFEEAVEAATEAATLAGIAKTQADAAVEAATEAATEAGIAKTQADEAVEAATEADDRSRNS